MYLSASFSLAAGTLLALNKINICISYWTPYTQYHPIPKMLSTLAEPAAESVASSTCVKSLSFHHCVVDVLVDDGFGAVLAQGDKWIQKKRRSMTKDNKAYLCWRTTQSRKPGTWHGALVWKRCIPPNCYFQSDTDLLPWDLGCFSPKCFRHIHKGLSPRHHRGTCSSTIACASLSRMFVESQTCHNRSALQVPATAKISLHPWCVPQPLNLPESAQCGWWVAFEASALSPGHLHLDATHDQAALKLPVS